MSHPYSGPASYIYANEHANDYEANGSLISSTRAYSHRTMGSSIDSSSPRSTVKSLSPMSDRTFAASVPQFSAELQSDQYKKFSASSYVGPPKWQAESQWVEPNYVYESMRVRFDTPNERIVEWRRQIKTAKRKLNRIRHGVAKFITRNWILAPRPRLSMIA